MVTPQYILPIHGEIVVDLFAGGGGASTGIEQALGRPVDIAINHDPEAIAMHTMNHPQTKHYCSDVFEIDPLVATEDRPVGLLWASPDCKHFSKAKGGKPVSKKIRSLAWVVVKWAKAVLPRIIMLENVEEFQTWGPLAADMKPDPAKKGRTFQRWISSLRKLGYKVEWKELRACDYGAPTIRKRLFIVARCDGQPIIWPSATHGDPKKPSIKACNLKPWKTAAECIDWSIPCPSIFERKKPLADNTLRRIAHGIVRYVINANEPFIVETAHSDVSPSGVKRWGKGVRSLKEPLTTITASGNGAALCTAFLAKHYSGVVGHGVKQPLGTITTADHHSVVAAHMVNLRGTSTAHGVTEPAKTITSGGNHAGLVAALLVKYYGNERDGVDITEPMHTIPTKDRFGLITVQINGEPHFITDICLRMFQPRELYRAQGFSDDYIIDRQSDSTPITKTAQTRMVGNSVSPPAAKALVRANYSTEQVRKAA